MAVRPSPVPVVDLSPATAAMAPAARASDATAVRVVRFLRPTLGVVSICSFVFILCLFLNLRFADLFTASREPSFPVARNSGYTNNSENLFRIGQQKLENPQALESTAGKVK